MQEIMDRKAGGDIGISSIWELIDPVWRMNDEQLVDLMASRIVYEDGESLFHFSPLYTQVVRFPKVRLMKNS